MNNIKKTFSIRDLENLSGIKAHTIRIWEKRYGLLSPDRTDTNIRTYNLENLKKLLNVTLLYDHGYKISKIAEIPDSEIPVRVREIISKSTIRSHAINAIKLSMVNYDVRLFHETCNSLIKDKPFREVFWEVFMPFLTELGLLWQSKSVNPSHEHFITHLIKQKIQTSTEKIEAIEPIRKDKNFVLFLPENELHDIGLLYLNYEIILRGYPTIYLGPSMPLEFMNELHTNFDNLHFISYFTVMPARDKLNAYIEEFTKELHKAQGSKLYILGRRAKQLTNNNLPDYVKAFESIEGLLETV